MTYDPAFDSAVTRETAWFTADPPPTFPTAPALQLANGGFFDLVQAYFPISPPRGRNLFIDREGSVERRISMGGEKEWEHRMLIHLEWDFETISGQLEVERQALDTAVAAVLTRLRGPLGDKSHNGQFIGVAEDMHEIDISYADPLAAVANREPLVVTIRYHALDAFPA